MKRLMFALLMAVSAGFATEGLAQEAADPTGTWEWTVDFGGNTMERVLTLALTDGELTGSVNGRNGSQTEISDASYQDGTVTFRVVRSFNGQEFAIDYTGTVSGDTLSGETRSTFDGQERTWDWVATRKPADAQD